MIVITITKSAPKGLNLIICIELFNPLGAVVFHHSKPRVSPIECTNLSRFMYNYLVCFKSINPTI